MIHIHCEHQGMIGDALSSVPYMLSLCDRYRTGAVITGSFSPAVMALLPDYPLLLDRDTDTASEHFSLDIHGVFDRHHQSVHMCQGYFRDQDEPLPSLPVSLKFLTLPAVLDPGIVLAPFSWSDGEGCTKTWPVERWLIVLRRLRELGHRDPVYVVGGARDDFSPYQGEPGIFCIQDRPLADVLVLLRTAVLVLSTDNGISHLAHYGGVSRHVLLYPGILPECWVPNPRGVRIRRTNPIDVQVADIVQLSLEVLGGQCGL